MADKNIDIIIKMDKAKASDTNPYINNAKPSAEEEISKKMREVIAKSMADAWRKEDQEREQKSPAYDIPLLKRVEFSNVQVNQNVFTFVIAIGEITVGVRYYETELSNGVSCSKCSTIPCPHVAILRNVIENIQSVWIAERVRLDTGEKWGPEDVGNFRKALDAALDSASPRAWSWSPPTTRTDKATITMVNGERFEVDFPETTKPWVTLPFSEDPTKPKDPPDEWKLIDL